MEKFVTSMRVKMAIVQARLGESIKEAWKRHLKKNPGDASIIIKIINQPVPQQ
jgi:hypothetical protein